MVSFDSSFVNICTIWYWLTSMPMVNAEWRLVKRYCCYCCCLGITNNIAKTVHFFTRMGDKAPFTTLGWCCFVYDINSGKQIPLFDGMVKWNSVAHFERFWQEVKSTVSSPGTVGLKTFLFKLMQRQNVLLAGCCCLCIPPRGQLLKKSAWLLQPNSRKGPTCRTR